MDDGSEKRGQKKKKVNTIVTEDKVELQKEDLVNTVKLN